MKNVERGREVGRERDGADTETKTETKRERETYTRKRKQTSKRIRMSVACVYLVGRARLLTFLERETHDGYPNAFY